MATDPERNSQFEGVGEKEEPASLNGRPRCPNCGWHDVRLSLSKGPLDHLLSTFSFKAFRCRSCGNRFHTLRRFAGQ